MLGDNLFKASFFESLVGGNLLVLGLWYLNRPFLLENFPHVAADVSSTGATGLGGKLVILTLSSVVAAILINHVVDAVVPVIVGDSLYAGKRYSRVKNVLIYCFRFITFSSTEDPRTVAIRRYLLSKRRRWFLEMARSWAKASEADLADRSEMVKVHQHITTRLRTLSDSSRKALADAYSEVAFAGGIFVALLLLMPASIAAKILNATVSVSTQYDVSMLFVLLGLYGMTVASGFLFRRRLRTFFSQVITLGMHYYDIQKHSNNKITTQKSR